MRMAGLVALLTLVPLLYGPNVVRMFQVKATPPLWRVDGPSCPPAPPGWAQSAPFKTFVMRDVAFSRHHGHLACTFVTEGRGLGTVEFPVCQFTSPSVIQITGRDGVAMAFAPGPGRPATVLARPTGVSCVVGARPTVFRR